MILTTYDFQGSVEYKKYRSNLIFVEFINLSSYRNKNFEDIKI